jgi:hypothetical protein
MSIACVLAADLQGLPNVILTPHIGGSTEEAQAAIGREVAAALIKFVNRGATSGAVNFPEVCFACYRHVYMTRLYATGEIISGEPVQGSACAHLEGDLHSSWQIGPHISQRIFLSFMASHHIITSASHAATHRSIFGL